MADAIEPKIDTAKAEVAAEKAYAAAAAAVEVKAVETKAVEVKSAAAPVVKPAAKVAAKKPAAKVAAPKAVVAKTPAKKVVAKKAVTKKVAAVKAAPKPIVKTPANKAATSLKDTIMAKTQIVAEDFTAKFKEAAEDAQNRAKAAFEKSNELAAEGADFAKGNIEALVESGKILAAGLQDLSKDYVAEGKSAFETMTADLKELAAVKSPADFLKLQGEMLRRNFDAAVASGSKNSEKVVKLAGDAFAPISSRVSLAVEKVKQAA